MHAVLCCPGPTPQAIFQGGGGTVLDSGTTFTYLPKAAFRAFVAAVDAEALANGAYREAPPSPEVRR